MKPLTSSALATAPAAAHDDPPFLVFFSDPASASDLCSNISSINKGSMRKRYMRALIPGLRNLVGGREYSTACSAEKARMLKRAADLCLADAASCGARWGHALRQTLTNPNPNPSPHPTSGSYDNSSSSSPSSSIKCALSKHNYGGIRCIDATADAARIGAHGSCASSALPARDRVSSQCGSLRCTIGDGDDHSTDMDMGEGSDGDGDGDGDGEDDYIMMMEELRKVIPGGDSSKSEEEGDDWQDDFADGHGDEDEGEDEDEDEDEDEEEEEVEDEHEHEEEAEAEDEDEDEDEDDDDDDNDDLSFLKETAHYILALQMQAEVLHTLSSQPFITL